jgi:hypothetical protein
MQSLSSIAMRQVSLRTIRQVGLVHLEREKARDILKVAISEWRVKLLDEKFYTIVNRGKFRPHKSIVRLFEGNMLLVKWDFINSEDKDEFFAWIGFKWVQGKLVFWWDGKEMSTDAVANGLY